jgi:hypothetical protein
MGNFEKSFQVCFSFIVDICKRHVLKNTVLMLSTTAATWGLTAV